MTLCLIALLALTRAEIIERMRAPVVTQADGMVQVFADCPEDMRRELEGVSYRIIDGQIKVNTAYDSKGFFKKGLKPIPAGITVAHP